MKKRMILAALLLLAFGTMKAQETLIPTPDGDGSKINTIVLRGSGPLKLCQGDKLTMNAVGSDARYRVEDSVLYLLGSGSREVTIPNLSYLEVWGGASSVQMKSGALRGKNLSIKKTGNSGIVDLLVDYDNVYVRSAGGKVTLSGKCNVFCSETLGNGMVDASKLDYKANIQWSGKQWNMAFNLDDSADRESLQNMVKEAQSFFNAESCRIGDEHRDVANRPNDTIGFGNPDMPQLDELMRELGVNLQQLSDSVDWEQFERDMEKWGADMEEWGRKMEKWADRYERKMEKWGDKHGRNYDYHFEYNNNRPGSKDEGVKDKQPEKRNLLFDAHWNGFEAGLNMLVDPTMTYVYNNPNGTTGMEIRPLRSWYFGFNIADVGIAFDRKHRVGLFTGVGLGWNNFSWNNDIKIGYDPETDGYTVVPIVSDQVVKNSKYGALFLQVPLMFEVRPTRHMYIDAGVTGGLRIAQWNRVKYENGNSDKQFYGGIGSGVRLFKLDASFRVGGENIGFFANYALLPIFEMSNAKVHPVSFGFSINF